MKSASRIASCFLLLFVLIGCRGYGNPFAPPGTMRQQQLEASVHDPYTEPDIGPEVVGGRPREFQKPLGEAVRNRYIWDSWSNP